MKKVWMSGITVLFLSLLILAGVKQKTDRQEVDVILFAGQSNMSGLGDASLAPEVPEGVGYEFRAMTDPTRLYPLKEPFGENEHNPGMCDDRGLLERTGSLVSAFVNSYYEQTHTPVVAVSASRGSSKLKTWMKEGNGLFLDAGQRLDSCLQYLNSSPDYRIRHIYMVWLQGESDTSAQNTPEDYEKGLTQLFDNFKILGVEKCFVIRIGLDLERDSKGIDHVIQAQTDLCRSSGDFILVSTQAVTLVEKGMMQDRMHYTQEGYNLIGEEAGANAGSYVATGKEPSMYDPYYDEEYEGKNES